MNDTEFVAALRRRDPAAIHHLTETYVPTVWRFVFFRVHGDRHLAEDIVSESVLAIMRAAAKGTEIHSPSAWLRTVATNKVNDHFRAAARVQHLIEEARQTGTHVEEDDAVAQEVLVEKRMEVRRAMDDLPEQHRLAMEWKYIEKLSVREIAQRLDVTEKAAESILFRARRELRAKLKPQDEDDETSRLRSRDGHSSSDRTQVSGQEQTESMKEVT
ncbi:RNA polymerase sigma factor [Thalassoroseus pseudoceratinae]|uniref:RNA polymerase sigma factor n=1 Tax=Thalassoroseus pseudoceratinae TaxID=2713176 RepID=UPI00141FDCCB|nr:RNA polymerase sigma factor [Thalassoroseus pseudoceratinae]